MLVEPRGAVVQWLDHWTEDAKALGFKPQHSTSFLIPLARHSICIASFYSGFKLIQCKFHCGWIYYIYFKKIYSNLICMCIFWQDRKSFWDRNFMFSTLANLENLPNILSKSTRMYMYLNMSLASHRTLWSNRLSVSSLIAIPCLTGCRM